MYMAFLIVIAYMIAIFVGHFFTKWVLGFLEFNNQSSGIERAGMLIGFLERALIVTFILMDAYQLIGFAIMAKSIARFEELKKREFAEYFLVGTLTSTLFGVLTGAILVYFLL